MAAPVSTTDRLLTPEELAERWQVVCEAKKAERVYAMVRAGQIPAGAVVRLGRENIRFRLEGIEAFEAQGGRGPEDAASWLNLGRRPVSGSKRPTLTTMSESQEMLILTRLMTAIMVVEFALRLLAVIPLGPGLAMVALALLARRAKARKRNR
jgi:hypothetical protein